ncbi:22694_t:CDS:2, partial [Dentiscutata erythropus]
MTDLDEMLWLVTRNEDYKRNDTDLQTNFSPENPYISDMITEDAKEANVETKQISQKETLIAILEQPDQNAVNANMELSQGTTVTDQEAPKPESDMMTDINTATNSNKNTENEAMKELEFTLVTSKKKKINNRSRRGNLPITVKNAKTRKGVASQKAPYSHT